MQLNNLMSAINHLPNCPVEYPVQDWHPQRQGEIDITIQADGRWWHEGGEIKRLKLVQLFSRLLAYREGCYWLVTPAEMLKIQVDYLPFILTYAACNEQGMWQFSTAYGHQVCLQEQVQWRWFNTPEQRPELHIRDDLWAGLSRQVFYELAVASESIILHEQNLAAIQSNKQTFVLGQLEE